FASRAYSYGRHLQNVELLMNRLHSGISVLVPESLREALPGPLPDLLLAVPRERPFGSSRASHARYSPVGSQFFSNTASTPALWLAESCSSEPFRYPAGTDNAVSRLLVNLLWPPWRIVDSMSMCRVMHVRQDGCPRVPVAGRRIGSMRPQT